MKTTRPAVSLPTLAAVVLVIAMLLGAGYYAMGRGGGEKASSAYVSSTTTSSAAAPSTSESGSPKGRVIMVFDAPNALGSSDVVANYTMTVTALLSAPTTLSLAAAAPPGIVVTIDPSQFTPGESAAPVASVQVSPGTQPGVYGVNVTATGGGETYSSALTLQVVTFLVVTVGTTFVPQNMTVPVNSTVYWMRLNGPISQYDNGQHNVVFLNGMASSPALQQWESWSYQFTAVGDYPYYCTFHPWQTGDVVVTS